MDTTEHENLFERRDHTCAWCGEAITDEDIPAEARERGASNLRIVNGDAYHEDCALEYI